MSKKVAINGFGRIGRLALRASISEKRNSKSSPSTTLFLLTTSLTSSNTTLSMEKRPFSVSADGKDLIVDGQRIHVSSERDPALLPWDQLGVDYVVESTGFFTEEADARKHLTAGAKRVVISAPAKGGVPTFVMGVNHTKYNPKEDFIISNASCTTNCLAPLTKILLDNFGIEEGLMTTVHAITATQPTTDGPSKKDWRGGRSGAYNIIPASTGAAKAVALCLPEVKNKLTGMAFRVPTADVSVVDLTVRLAKDTTYEEICHTIQRAAEGPMRGIVEFCDEEVVSSDFIGNTASCIFDKGAGIALNSRFFKLIAWYDNEIGYSNRIVDLLEYMASKE